MISGSASFPDAKKPCKKKSSTSSSDSESETETQLKIASIRHDSYSIALRRATRDADENPSGLSVDDFLKLDIIATDSDLETERLRKATAGHLEKTSESPLDSLLAGGYESSQQRLMTITKSWTELQDKIKREREISEIQLKALDEGSLGDANLVENKLTTTDGTVDLETQRRLSASGNEDYEKPHQDPERKIDGPSNVTIVAGAEEVPQEQRNGVSQVPEEDDESTLTIETAKRQATEFEVTTNAEELQKFLTEENGVANEVIADDRDSSTDIKVVNYNKKKLLAAMKAIDDNENIEFLSNRKNRVVNTTVRSQSNVTDNLYRGLPSHARKKDDILKELFGDSKAETKLRSGCSKLH